MAFDQTTRNRLQRFVNDARRVLEEEFIRDHCVVPLSLTSESLELAMVDPVNQETIQAVREITGLRVIPKFVLENEFEEFLERHHLRST